MREWASELLFAFRGLRRTPAFTLVAVLTLALGIGANTALFSMVYAVLLADLPFRDPDRLYWVWSRHTSTDRYPFQLPEFCDYRDQNHSFSSLAGFGNWNANLTGDGPAERLSGLRVTGDFFETLGARPFQGRLLAPADDVPGNEKVVVLTHGLWQRRFGGDSTLVGRSVLLNGEPFTVVGILPREFLFPTRNIEVAVPMAPDKDPWRQNRKSTHFVRAVGRLKDGVTAIQAREDLGAIADRLQREFPESYARKKGVLAVAYREELTRNFSQTLWLLLGAVFLLLLVACANLASLMLVRAGGRRRELAVRTALGASGARIVRPLLLESLLLGVSGAALGVLLAHLVVPALVAASPTPLPRAQQVRLSLPVLAFTSAMTLIAVLGCGLLPALRARRYDPSHDLGAESRGATGGRDWGRVRGMMVAGQVALLAVLLCGGGLLYRSFRAVTAVDPGFTRGALTVRMSLPRNDYGSIDRLSAFYRDLEARVAAIPGVRAVAAVNQLPLNGALASTDYKVADRPPARDDQAPTAQYRMVTPAFFAAMGIARKAGRVFGEEDREGTALVAVVNEALARQSFPDRDPVGLHLMVADTQQGFRSMEIVGVVADVKHGSLEGEAEPHLYVAYHQTNRDLLVWLTNNQFLVVRTEGPPLALAEAVRRAVAAVDSNVAAADVRPTDAYLDAAAGGRRYTLVLLGLFAGVALLLATVGLYGVVAGAVAQQARETGVRLALGASARHIFGRVLGLGLRHTAVGIVVGLGAAGLLGRALHGLLFAVSAADPWTYASVVLVLLAAALAACLWPAWRAAHADPLVVLRQS